MRHKFKTEDVLNDMNKNKGQVNMNIIQTWIMDKEEKELKYENDIKSNT